MNTFTGVEWGQGNETPAAFDPTDLDTDQWCRLFKESGLSGVILTVKHHDGFCLWDSKFTKHDVASSPWKAGRGDVLRELADSCEKYGLWLGVYISPWDRNNPIYGKDDAAYNDYFDGQLEELLGGYGPIGEVWWDGANGDRNNPEKHQQYDWARFISTVRRLQPDAVIFAPPTAPGDVRWVGNEVGEAGQTQWATYPAFSEEIPARLNVGVEGADAWMPAETDVSIRPGWYWTKQSDSQVKSVEQLVRIHEQSVGRNTNLLLNFPVDRRGLVHEADAAALRGLAAVLKATYQTDLAGSAVAAASESRGQGSEAANLIDGDAATYWAAGDGSTSASVTLKWPTPICFDRVVMQEHVELGQRVRGWRLEARVGGVWSEVSRGTTIGHKRIALFEPVESSALRLTITDSRACPTLETLGVHLGPARVSIEPDAAAFVDTQQVRLNADRPGCKVYFTLDGSEPDASSTVYAGPITIDSSCEVRAVAATRSGVSPLISRKHYTVFASDSLREPQPSDGLNQGLRVERFEGAWQTLDQMKDRQPVSSGVCDSFAAAERTRDDHAALRFTGFIRAPSDGVYEFHLESDDGSRLRIGDDLIVDHDGIHGMNFKSGSVALRRGWHPIQLEWFNVGAGLGLNVEWSGPGLKRGPIDPGSLGCRPAAERVSVRRISYEGWRECFEIANGVVRVVVVPSIGHVMYYGRVGGPNLLHIDDRYRGMTLPGGEPLIGPGGKKIWATFGGDRIWPTEERLFAPLNGAMRPPDPTFDGAAWSAASIERGVAIESGVSPYCGAQVRRAITLAQGSSVVSIDQTIRKAAVVEAPELRPLPLTIWSISMVDRPEALLFPIRATGSPFQGGAYVPDWQDADNRAAINLSVKDGVALLADGLSDEGEKAGADAPGWVAAVMGDVVLGHFFDFDRKAQYPDGGTSVTVYRNNSIGELEVLSPLARLEPGESLSHAVRWDTSPLRATDLQGRIEEAIGWASDPQRGRSP